MLLPKAPATAASTIVQNIDIKMQQKKEFSPQRIGISIGTVTLLSPDASFEASLTEADMEMYKVKAKRKEQL